MGLEDEPQNEDHDDDNDDQRHDPETRAKCQDGQAFSSHASPFVSDDGGSSAAGRVLGVCIGVDLAGLRFVVFGCGTFLLSALCLLFSG
jgi:hypothetical protein